MNSAALKKRANKTPADIQVPCSLCRGTGKKKLAGPLADTFSLFPHQSTRLTAEQICAKLGNDVNVTAMNNRLEKLRQLGLLDRFRAGHAFVYFAKPMN